MKLIKIGGKMKKKVMAIFGGSFNPPANSHINLAKQILEKNKEIEKVIFVPVNVKYNKKGLASNEDRFFMLQKICENNQGLEVSDIEIKSSRQLYTIETLDLIQEKYKNYEIYFILGTDNLKEFETWNNPETILTRFKLLVLERGEDKIKEIIEKNDLLKEHKQAIIELSNLEKINLSSTEIREKVKRGESINDLVPNEIIDMVLALYQ